MRAAAASRVSLSVLSTLVLLFAALCLTAIPRPLSAQEMPDPKQMSGIPRPVTDLPSGSVSVRLIKGELSNNIAGHPVELHVGGKTLKANTDEAGRAQFDRLPPGETIRATAVVDGEALESQEFPAPSSGGIRLMLVATDREREARAAAEANLPPVPGIVVIGGDSRIVIEPTEDTVSVYYILEIMNNAKAPVNPPTPFVFDMPAGMVNTAVLQGSSPLASNDGEHVQIRGPFPSGKTVVEVGGTLPVTSGTLEFTQRFPVAFEQPVFIAKRDGALKVTSPQFDRIQEVTADNGTPITAGAAKMLPPGQPITFTLSGLPHYSSTPRIVALSLALLVAIIGVVMALRAPAEETPAAERRQLIARREKLFQDLVRIERDHRQGKLDDARYQPRREELLASLEAVYGALDREHAAEEVVAGRRIPPSTRPVGASS